MTINTDTMRELAAMQDRYGRPIAGITEALRQAADTIEAQRKLLEQARDALCTSGTPADTQQYRRECRAHNAITEHLKAHP